MPCSLIEDLDCPVVFGCCFRNKLSMVEETCFKVIEQWRLSCSWEADFLGSSVSCRKLKPLRWAIPRILFLARFSSTKMHYKDSNPCFKNQTIQVEQQRSSIAIFGMDSNCTSWEPRMSLICVPSSVWNLQFESSRIPNSEFPEFPWELRRLLPQLLCLPPSSQRRRSKIHPKLLGCVCVWPLRALNPRKFKNCNNSRIQINSARITLEL